MASKEYWEELMKELNALSDEEFEYLLKEVEKAPPLFAVQQVVLGDRTEINEDDTHAD